MHCHQHTDNTTAALLFLFYWKEALPVLLNHREIKWNKSARHQIVKGGGNSIYLPSAPEVPMQSMARLSSKQMAEVRFFQSLLILENK
ncbi:MAG: hypothetical protein R2825_15965 [Saprospiraceae bacterium]